MNTLINGNCIEEMRKMESNSIDLILTDPPYSLPNNQFRPEARIAQRSFSEFSPYQMFFEAFVVEVRRLLKETGSLIVFCDETFYPVIYPSLYRHFYATKMLVWDKEWIGMGGIWRRQFEVITHSYLIPQKEKSGDGDVLHYKPVAGKDKLHTSQKPVELLRTLIRKSTKSSATVFDPFMGSGSTGVAAQLEGRRFIGIELEGPHFQIAEARLKEAYQLTLQAAE